MFVIEFGSKLIIKNNDNRIIAKVIIYKKYFFYVDLEDKLRYF